MYDYRYGANLFVILELQLKLKIDFLPMSFCSILYIIVSPYQFSSTDGSVRNKSPGTLFFVFDHKTVPMYRTYVLCTRERRNISLIEM